MEQCSVWGGGNTFSWGGGGGGGGNLFCWGGGGDSRASPPLYETLLYSGVKLKIGDICLYMCVCGRTYVICTLTLSYFVVQKFTNRILWFIDHYLSS